MRNGLLTARFTTHKPLVQHFLDASKPGTGMEAKVGTLRLSAVLLETYAELRASSERFGL